MISIQARSRVPAAQLQEEEEEEVGVGGVVVQSRGRHRCLITAVGTKLVEYDGEPEAEAAEFNIAPLIV